MKHCVFPMICGSGGSKSRLDKAAGAEPAGQMRDEKVHAIVARSTFPSQNVQNTPFSDLKHLSVHQWIRSAIPDSQQPTSPIGFLFLKLPPPPCAVLLVDYGHDRTISNPKLLCTNKFKQKQRQNMAKTSVQLIT